MVRRIEEVAHLPPGFVVDLFPLGAPIGYHVEATQLEFVILGLELVLGQVDDRIIFVDLHQHLLAIEADLVAVDVAQNCLLAILQAVGAEMPLLLAPVPSSSSSSAGSSPTSGGGRRRDRPPAGDSRSWPG